MIRSFKSREARRIWEGAVSKRLPPDIQPVVRRKLRMLHNARILGDLRIPPGNRLEELKGELKNWYSIRVNDKWRICFLWDGADAQEIDILDYHH